MWRMNVVLQNSNENVCEQAHSNEFIFVAAQFCVHQDNISVRTYRLWVLLREYFEAFPRPKNF